MKFTVTVFIIDREKSLQYFNVLFYKMIIYFYKY